MELPQRNLSLIAETLSKHQVDYVLVGGAAVILRGAITTTEDVDLAFDASVENLSRLADALQDLRAKPKRWLTTKYRLQLTDLASGWLHLQSEAGDIDLIHRTPGTTFAALNEDAESLPIGKTTIRVASPKRLLAMKRVAGRPRDIQHAAQLEEILKLRGEEP